jgi:hypothetical protein
MIDPVTGRRFAMKDNNQIRHVKVIPNGY